MHLLPYVPLVHVLCLVASTNGEAYTYANQSVSEDNVIAKFPGITVTSCFGKCKLHGECHVFAFLEKPMVGKTTECYLLNNGDIVHTGRHKYDGEVTRTGRHKRKNTDEEEEVVEKTLFLFVVKELVDVLDYFCPRKQSIKMGRKENPLCLIKSVDGGWGQWSNYALCSVTCDVGARSRRRHCNNPYPSYGGDDCLHSNLQIYVPTEIEEKVCTSKNTCLANWGPWSDYSRCSISCGKGVKERRRTCDNGNRCLQSDNATYGFQENMAITCWKFVICQRIAIKSNQMVSKMGVLEKEFTIKFYLYPTEYDFGLRNVIGFSQGESCCEGGDLMPSLWIRSSPELEYKLQFAMNGSSTGQKIGNAGALKLDKWNMILISQQNEDGIYYFLFSINTVIHWKVVNTTPLEFHNVSIWSGKWYKAQPGYIRNLTIHGGIP